MKTTVTDLRSHLYQYLDRVLEDGEIIEVERKGRIVKIIAESPPSKLGKLQKRNTIIGDPESIVHMDWSDEWNPSGDAYMHLDTHPMNSICVYCGSSFGSDPAYKKAASETGRVLAEGGIRVIYGGGKVGLMGTLAKAALAVGGEVIGVIPEALKKKEVALEECSELRVVGSMHERKAMMAELADGFIAMPGGFGTLEELFEALTWLQLGIHAKPCGLLNIGGYYDGLLTFLGRAASDRFIRQEHFDMIQVEKDPKLLVEKMGTFKVPKIDKAAWIKETALE